MVRVLQRQWGGNGIGSDSTPTTSSFAHASALASVAKVCGDPRNMFLSSEDRWARGIVKSPVSQRTVRADHGTCSPH